MKKIGTMGLVLALSLVMLTGCSLLGGILGEERGDGYAVDGYAEGEMGDTLHTYFFDYTVNSAYLCDSFEEYEATQEGFRLLVAEVTVKNTFSESIPMYDVDFQVQWGEGATEYDVPITYYVEAVSDQQLPDEYELETEESRTGLLVFEVPEGTEEFSISYLEYFDDGSEGDVFFVDFSAEDRSGAESV